MYLFLPQTCAPVRVCECCVQDGGYVQIASEPVHVCECCVRDGGYVQIASEPVHVCECCVQNGGYVQITSAEKLRPFIQSKPVVLGRPQPAQEDIASRMVSCFHSLPQLKTGVTLCCNVRGQIHSKGQNDCVRMFFYYPTLWEATHCQVSISGGGCCYARSLSCLKIVPTQLCRVYHFSVAFVFLLVSVCCNPVQAKAFEQCVTKSRWKPMNRTTGARPLPS